MPERPPLRVLIVDDDADMVRLLRGVLAAGGFTHVAHVDTGRAAIDAAAGADVLLLDHQLPDMSGIEVLDLVGRVPSAPSVVMVTAYGSESLAAAALRHGAEDYLVKDAALGELLPQVLERVRRTRALRGALAAAEQELVRAERLAAIGEISVTLHHEINNPLMAAMAEVDLALASRGLSADLQEGMANARTALLRIRDVVKKAGSISEAQSKHYASGMSMIDIDGRGQGAQPGARALLLAADEDLARVTALLLKQAGFQVDRYRSADELSVAASMSDVRLVVIASPHGAPPLGGFRPSRSRGYRIAALTGGFVEAARAAGADHVVTLPFDPATLGAELLALAG